MLTWSGTVPVNEPIFIKSFVYYVVRYVYQNDIIRYLLRPVVWAIPSKRWIAASIPSLPRLDGMQSLDWAAPTSRSSRTWCWTTPPHSPTSTYPTLKGEKKKKKINPRRWLYSILLMKILWYVVMINIRIVVHLKLRVPRSYIYTVYIYIYVHPTLAGDGIILYGNICS